jgi:hypothetical protein
MKGISSNNEKMLRSMRREEISAERFYDEED